MADAFAAVAADVTAAFSTTYLAGLLDEQGLMGEPVNIELGDALVMRDVAVAGREAALLIAAQVEEQGLRRSQMHNPHNPTAPTFGQLAVISLRPPPDGPPAIEGAGAGAAIPAPGSSGDSGHGMDDQPIAPPAVGCVAAQPVTANAVIQSPTQPFPHSAALPPTGPAASAIGRV